MREVTEKELEALSTVLGHTISDTGDSVKDGTTEGDSSETVTQKTKAKKPFYKNYLFYASLTVFLGSLVALSVAFVLYSVNQTLGEGVLSYFASTGALTDEALAVAHEYNVNGLQQAVFIYQNMWLVFGGIAFVTLLIALVFVYLDARRKEAEEGLVRQQILDELKKEQEFTEEEIEIMEDSRIE